MDALSEPGSHERGARFTLSFAIHGAHNHKFWALLKEYEACYKVVKECVDIDIPYDPTSAESFRASCHALYTLSHADLFDHQGDV